MHNPNPDAVIVTAGRGNALLGALLHETTVELAHQPDGVRGHVDRPKQGTRVEAAALDLAGWALGEDVAVVAVELVRDGAVFRRLPLGVSRPDLAAAFPAVPGADEAGFRASVSVLGHEPELSLELHAVLADQRRVRFATIRAERGWRESSGPERELVSVVIPCYDQAHYLGEAIESVLAQTYPQIELLVVDDGSHDNTAAVAARYPGVRYLRQDNEGLAAARNTGIRHTNGDFLVFLDADDRLLPHALETGLGHMREHPEAAFVSGHHRLIASGGLVLSESDIPCAENGHLEALLRRNYIAMHGTVMYRRGVFEHVGPFDESLEACEDYDLYLRIGRDFPFYCHHRVIADYRQHAAALTRDPAKMLRAKRSVLRARYFKGAGQGHGLQAYRQGLAFASSYYGPRLVVSIREGIAAGRMAEVARGLVTLARHHPRGLAELAGKLRPPSRRRR